MTMHMCCKKQAAQDQLTSYAATRTTENVAVSKYLGSTVTKQDYIQDEIQDGLH